MNLTFKYVAKSFLWSVSSKVLDAGIKFASVPILLAYFGKDNFALITLATSVNAYIVLLDMGMNTGAIKYFSEWINSNKLSMLDSVARTSILFYCIVGIINCIILLLIAVYGIQLFAVSPNQVASLQNLFYILAAFAIANWSLSVFNQLLIANESIDYIQKVNIIKSIANLLVIIATIKLSWSLTAYFLMATLVNSLVVFPFYIKSRKANLIQNFTPKADYRNFSVILKYSLSIMAIAVFQISANTSRPIILSIFSTRGLGIVADYRVMETITIFIISVGGIFTSIFLPKTSKLLAENNSNKIQNFAYAGTLYTSIVCVMLCIPFVLCSEELIVSYVGKAYLHLKPWLITWLLTVLFFLHSTPINSIILSSGKTRLLVYCTAISCITSIIINVAFCNTLGVGSAVVGYTVYIAIQMSFYYLYFNNVVLKLDSYRVFKSFLIPALIGIVCMTVVLTINVTSSNLVIQAALKITIWVLMFVASLGFGKIIPILEIARFLKMKS